jgi:hypothetical protein
VESIHGTYAHAISQGSDGSQSLEGKARKIAKSNVKKFEYIKKQETEKHIKIHF